MPAAGRGQAGRSDTLIGPGPATHYPQVVHIVHVIARLNDGGPARVLASLARTMIARGHRVTVLAGDCAADEPDLSAEVRSAGATLVRIPGFGRRLRPTGDATALFFLVAQLRRLAPDVVHTHTAKAGVVGRFACRLLRLRCLHTITATSCMGISRSPATWWCAASNA